MRLISPPNLKTTIYDKHISGLVFSKSEEYCRLGENILREIIVPDGFYWIVNSVALRLGYITQQGIHHEASLKVCVRACSRGEHLLGLSIYPGDGILDKNMSISPGLVLNERWSIIVSMYMSGEEESVYVSYYIALNQVKK